MKKSFNRLWVFGDSHSTPNYCVDPQHSFWRLAAIQLGVKTIVNCSRVGMSFDSVCQILVGEQQRYDFDQDFFIIGLPPLERITVFDDYKDTALSAWVCDVDTGGQRQEVIRSHHGLINLQYKELDKMAVLTLDRSWLETQILRQLFLVTQWLDRCNASYVFVNLSKNLDSNNVWGPSEVVLNYCQDHARLHLFQNSLYDVNLNLNRPVDYDQYGWHGHHGPAGNRHFFETTIKNNLC